MACNCNTREPAAWVDKNGCLNLYLAGERTRYCPEGANIRCAPNGIVINGQVCEFPVGTSEVASFVYDEGDNELVLTRSDGRIFRVSLTEVYSDTYTTDIEFDEATGIFTLFQNNGTSPLEVTIPTGGDPVPSGGPSTVIGYGPDGEPIARGITLANFVPGAIPDEDYTRLANTIQIPSFQYLADGTELSGAMQAVDDPNTVPEEPTLALSSLSVVDGEQIKYFIADTPPDFLVPDDGRTLVNKEYLASYVAGQTPVLPEGSPSTVLGFDADGTSIVSRGLTIANFAPTLLPGEDYSALAGQTVVPVFSYDNDGNETGAALQASSEPDVVGRVVLAATAIVGGTVHRFVLSDTPADGLNPVTDNELILVNKGFLRQAIADAMTLPDVSDTAPASMTDDGSSQLFAVTVLDSDDNVTPIEGAHVRVVFMNAQYPGKADVVGFTDADGIFNGPEAQASDHLLIIINGKIAYSKYVGISM